MAAWAGGSDGGGEGGAEVGAGGSTVGAGGLAVLVLDLGRPDRVGLLFPHRITRKTPPPAWGYRTRVITDGVEPSLHVEYKSSHVKQYFKEQRALRTETTINDTRDLRIRRRVTAENFDALVAVGHAANQRLSDAQLAAALPAPDVATFTHVTQPSTHDGVHAAALRFGDPRVMALMHASVGFAHVLAGFHDLPAHPDVEPAMRTLAEQSREGPVAVVAGREDSGLTNEELDHCQVLVTIETDPRHRSLNLSHAVGIFCYESWLARATPPSLKPPRRPAAGASSAKLELLFRDWERALWAVEFFKARRPEIVMRSVREALFRAELDWREASLLRAMMLETVRYLERARVPFELPEHLRDVGRLEDQTGPDPSG